MKTDLNQYDHVEVCDVEVHATPGAAIGYAIQDAVLLAAKEWRNVVLTHNGKRYQIKINDLAACAKPMHADDKPDGGENAKA